MSRVLISGGRGLVGRFISNHFAMRGDIVVTPSRNEAPLDSDADYTALFGGVDIFVHCAFSHAPGKYRGGEGDDPDAFRRANVDGTMAIMRAAKAAGVPRVFFLSSRAVYDGIAPDTVLTEEMPCAPTSLYGEVKLAVEQRLVEIADNKFMPISLRATGVYGASAAGAHKWSNLFTAFERGEDIAPRVATEVHGDDLAKAISLLADVPRGDLLPLGPAPLFNVSDLVLDRRDLLAAYVEKSGVVGKLPDRADASQFNVMDCDRLQSLGWQPRGALGLTGF